MKELKKISYGRQWIFEEDIEEVVKVLKSDWLTQGPDIEEFEKAVANYVNAKYAVAFNSGTAALHGAYFAAGLKEGDELITSPITFVSTSNAAAFLGATPVFVDIDMKTYCIDPQKIEEKITSKTKAIAPISLAGYPVDISKIKEIAKKHNLVVVEDAAHALGAIRNGKMVGEEADITVFSFHPVKPITTGEGGMAVTNNKEFYEKLKIFRTHGITKDEKYLTKNDGPWYYEQHYLGFNYRLNDFQSALGLSQLKKIEKFVERRNKIAATYDKAFKDNPLLTIPPRRNEDNWRHAYHIYPLLLDSSVDRKEVFMKLREKGIYCQVHYIPVHTQPYYREKFGYKFGDYPVAEEYYRREITIPLYPKMEDEDVDYVIKSIREVLE